MPIQNDIVTKEYLKQVLNETVISALKDANQESLRHMSALAENHTHEIKGVVEAIMMLHDKLDRHIGECIQ